MFLFLLHHKKNASSIRTYPALHPFAPYLLQCFLPISMCPPSSRISLQTCMNKDSISLSLCIGGKRKLASHLCRSWRAIICLALIRTPAQRASSPPPPSPLGPQVTIILFLFLSLLLSHQCCLKSI